MDSNSILTILVAAWKDKVQSECLENIRAETFRLLQADADARRVKASETILAMARLKNQLFKFETTYSMLADSCGKVEAVEEYIDGIKLKIKKLSFTKNHLLH